MTFGLFHYPYSEFELMAEELLMSDSIIKVDFATSVFLSECALTCALGSLSILADMPERLLFIVC